MMSEPIENLIIIQMTDDAEKLHEQVAKNLERYAKSPGDFNPISHGVIAIHLRECQVCQRALNSYTDQSEAIS